MKRTLDNIIGAVGVFASTAIGLFSVVSLLLAGPRVIPFVRTPLALLEEIALSLILPTGSGDLRVPAYWLYLPLYAMLFAAFGWALWRRTSYRVQRPAGADFWLLAAQVAIALAIEPQLLILTAGVFAFVLPRRSGFVWLGTQMVLFAVVQTPYIFGVDGLLLPALNLSVALIDIGMQLAWMVVAFGIGFLAAVERRGRLKLALTNAQLQGTQHLLADTLRVSERMRISRNLHDAIGHHLTALNLHLDLGLRQSGEAALESFQLSRQLAQGLLGEVRSIVGIEREERTVSLRQALELLCSGIPVPRVDLQYDQTIDIDDPALAEVIFRCIQEALTNAMRHANAACVQIGLRKLADAIDIEIGDDGAGNKLRGEGNGLRGMRERIDEFGGSFSAGNRPQGGFGIHILLPHAGKLSGVAL